MQVSRGLLLVGRLTICALAGLLVFYHAYTLYDLYLGSGTDIYDVGNANTHDLYRHIQSILRVLIISSLVLVVLNKRPALYGMWIAIASLVATHYWAYFFDLPFRFLQGTHPLSYLKGFIIPTVITLLFLATHSHGASDKRAA
ncbi:hypothetical protein [Dokdonella sp.]|uniref:hypothetical protein n=1 Tax=Dokdonella sp. TaxID=2291710 RepID=UPI002F3EB240